VNAFLALSWSLPLHALLIHLRQMALQCVLIDWLTDWLIDWFISLITLYSLPFPPSFPSSSFPLLFPHPTTKQPTSLQNLVCDTKNAAGEHNIITLGRKSGRTNTISAPTPNTVGDTYIIDDLHNRCFIVAALSKCKYNIAKLVDFFVRHSYLFIYLKFSTDI